MPTLGKGPYVVSTKGIEQVRTETLLRIFGGNTFALLEADRARLNCCKRAKQIERRGVKRSDGLASKGVPKRVAQTLGNERYG